MNNLPPLHSPPPTGGGGHPPTSVKSNGAPALTAQPSPSSSSAVGSSLSGSMSGGGATTSSGSTHSRSSLDLNNTTTSAAGCGVGMAGVGLVSGDMAVTSGISTSASTLSSVSTPATLAAQQPTATTPTTKEDAAKGGASTSGFDWRPPFPRLCAYHDCNSLAAAWGIGPPTISLEAAQATGASMAQSPANEDDVGDGKFNDLLASCPAFRNELGGEPVRHVALSSISFFTAQSSALLHPAAGTKQQSTSGDCETWHREHTASEAGVLEDVSNVYLGGRLCAARQSKVVIEPQDVGSYYFRHCFAGRPHVDYFGNDEQLGPLAVSMVKELSERKDGSHALYRLIVRISDLLTVRVAVPEEALADASSSIVAPTDKESKQNEPKSMRSVMRELIELVCPQLPFNCLRPALASPRVEELLLKLDEQPIYTRYKVGVLYCGPGQSTEAEMYNNEHASPAFEEFLDFLGTRVRLRGFDAYKGGLDTRGDTTGLHSVYSEYASHEVMFHVSTLLPYTPNNKQQLSRKRHIGNDMVTIIFQEPDALPFSPITVRSHFQHVFIVIRVSNPCTENVSYGIAVSRARDVPPFGPPLKAGATYLKCADFHDFLLTKIINAENAVHRSKKFASMARRTRREALKDLVENYVAAHSAQESGPSRIASRLLGGSVKNRKERQQLPKPVMSADLRGALSWMVEVLDHSLNRWVNCVLGVSADSIVALDTISGMPIFATPTHSVLGWARETKSGLKIYFDHGDVLVVRCALVDDAGYGKEDEGALMVVRRLEAVSNGDEAKELILRKQQQPQQRGPSEVGCWGFHLQDEGIVTDVEMYTAAWKIGLRQGSRVVEIEGVAMVALGTEQLAQMLTEQNQLRVMMIAPTADGNPRRGCEDQNCPAIRGQEALMLTPDTFAKQPLTYQEMFKQRNSRDYTSIAGGADGIAAAAAAASSYPHHYPISQSSMGSFEEQRTFSFGSYNSGKVREDPFHRRVASSQYSHQQQRASIPSGTQIGAGLTVDESLMEKKHSAPASSGPPPSVPRGHTTSTVNSLSRGATTGEGICAADLRRLSRSDDLMPVSSRGSIPTTTTFNPPAATMAHQNYSVDLGGIMGTTRGDRVRKEEEMMGGSDGLGERNLSFDCDSARYQWMLRKSAVERRELEALNDQMAEELAMERRAHEATRRYLDTLKQFCHAAGLSGIPEQSDEEL